ncbi:MAG: cold shock domain-containing protein [Desulfobacteraceae bacterium]|nr:cold shock domain-containing protein [Desulfobacteraceae bacterium]
MSKSNRFHPYEQQDGPDVFVHHLDINGNSFKDLNEGVQFRFDIEHLMQADPKSWAYNKT